MRMPFIAVITVLFTLYPCASAERAIGGAVSTPEPANVEGRVALVIGNAAYKDAPLQNPANDADDMAAALRKCGFEVIQETDCTLRAMMDALDQFGQRIRGREASLFYFAGHGLQVDGINYLVPLGADIEEANEVRFECLNADRVLAKMEAGGTRVNIVILDACRDNPLARAWRSLDKGLAPMNAPRGSLMAFAAAPGGRAEDGTGRNGLYTGCLLRHLLTPGLTVEEVLMRASDDVQKATNRKQVPWRSSNLTGHFYLKRGPVIQTGDDDHPPPEATAIVGRLQVAVNAPEATVLIDDREVGKARLDKALTIEDLPAGRVCVTVRAEGYEEQIRWVEINEEQPTQARFTLKGRTKPDGPRPGTEPVPPEVVATVGNGGDAPPFLQLDAAKMKYLSNLGPSDTVAVVLGNVEQLAESNEVVVRLVRERWSGTVAPRQSGLTKDQAKDRLEAAEKQAKAEGTMTKDQAKAHTDAVWQQADTLGDAAEKQAKAEGTMTKDQAKAHGDAVKIQAMADGVSLPPERKPPRTYVRGMEGATVPRQRGEKRATRPRLFLLKEVAQEYGGRSYTAGTSVLLDNNERRVTYRLTLVNVGGSDFSGDIIILDRLDERFIYEDVLRIHRVATNSADSPDLWGYAPVEATTVGLSATVSQDTVRYEFRAIKIERERGVALEFSCRIHYPGSG